MTRHAAYIALALSLLASLHVSSACAQTQPTAAQPTAAQPTAAQPTPAQPAQTQPAVDEARAAFADGLAAAEDERWSDAERAFRRSYALSGAQVALLNLAHCLQSLGRPREARDSFARLLGDTTLDADLRAEAERGLAEAATHVAHARLEGAPSEPVEVQVDGVPTDPEVIAQTLRLELDPGTHALAVSAPGRVSWSWRGALEPGQELTLMLDLPLVPHEASILESPWLWLTVGLVVAAGVGVGVGLWAQDNAQLDPRGSPITIRL